MCFPNTTRTDELEEYYEQDGSINEPQVIQFIPDEIHHHIDNPVLNDDLEEGILAFIYVNSNGIHIVYTSFEAEIICGEYCEYCDTMHID